LAPTAVSTSAWLRPSICNSSAIESSAINDDWQLLAPRNLQVQPLSFIDSNLGYEAKLQGMRQINQKR
jgi:hypothetical protein